MTQKGMAVLRALVILAGCAVLIAGCDRTNQTESEASARAANARTDGEAPAVTGSTVQQDQPADPPSDVPVVSVLVKETAEQDVAPNEQPAAGESHMADAKVIAYYFHRTMRCPTCLSIENQAREAIEAGYADELESGQLEWHAVNIEAPGSEHFEQDFELETSSLILTEMVGDEVVRWKNLTDVWELVEDSFEFQVYVWAELAEFL